MNEDYRELDKFLTTVRETNVTHPHVIPFRRELHLFEAEF